MPGAPESSRRTDNSGGMLPLAATTGEQLLIPTMRVRRESPPMSSSSSRHANNCDTARYQRGLDAYASHFRVPPTKGDRNKQWH